jgi:hypothetical protein
VPEWIRDDVEAPMVATGIIPSDFINSVAVNIYHDGTEVLQSCFPLLPPF